MVELLRKVRLERNGVVADTMGYYGTAYGLNYGVSLPTIREIASSLTPDNSFAHFLFLQDVRELRLIALHIAQPEQLSPWESPVWAAGIINSEIAEEAAFALFSKAELLPELFNEWIKSDNTLLQYTVLLAAAHSHRFSNELIAPALEALHKIASSANDSSSKRTMPLLDEPVFVNTLALDPRQAAHLVAMGVIALLSTLAAQNEENRLAVIRAIGSLGKLPAEDYVHEELTWRLEA